MIFQMLGLGRILMASTKRKKTENSEITLFSFYVIGGFEVWRNNLFNSGYVV